MNASEQPMWQAPLFCVPGRELQAYTLLSDLDEHGLSIRQALEFDPDGADWSIEVFWWWRAASIFRPDLADGRRRTRLLYTQVDLALAYGDRRPIERTCPGLADTVLVSSCRGDRTHQPALDLDYPARLGEIDGEGLHLWMLPESPALRYHGQEAISWADAAMRQMGLVRVDAPQAETWLDHAPRGRVAAALAAGWQQRFEDLMETVVAIEPAARSSLPEGGVWYRVEGQAWLIPSTSWYHLYTDTVVAEDSYIAAVDAAAACGLLNPGFANAARERRYTSLRRPGLMKPPTVWVEVDDIPF